MTTHEIRATLLGAQIAKRLEQLGMSRRELCRRIPISKQTLHDLEHSSGKAFKDSTFAALDMGLKWDAGTSRAFHEGQSNARDRLGAMSPKERIDEYLGAILRHLSEMDIDQLEREVLMLEDESTGRLESGDSNTRKLINRQINRMVAAWKHEGLDHQINMG